MSIFVIHNSHELHQLKKVLPLLRGLSLIHIAFVLVGSFMLAGCSKDEILNHYNNIVQSAGSIELTGKSSLQGEKEKGIDDYTGTYTADYANLSLIHI